MRDDEPILLFRDQEMVMLECVLATMTGREGGPGNVEGSGDLKKAMLGFVGDSKRRYAVQVAFPLRDEATHVY